LSTPGTPFFQFFSLFFAREASPGAAERDTAAHEALFIDQLQIFNSLYLHESNPAKRPPFAINS
ncbi:hypothetical protein, partial [Treponema sp.]|uniref:hypothetical protein n=1 Tax=Treponema sp. TaxID=166 RepID=UPI003F036A4F